MEPKGGLDHNLCPQQNVHCLNIWNPISIHKPYTISWFRESHSQLERKHRFSASAGGRDWWESRGGRNKRGRWSSWRAEGSHRSSRCIFGWSARHDSGGCEHFKTKARYLGHFQYYIAAGCHITISFLGLFFEVLDFDPHPCDVHLMPGFPIGSFVRVRLEDTDLRKYRQWSMGQNLWTHQNDPKWIVKCIHLNRLRKMRWCRTSLLLVWQKCAEQSRRLRNHCARTEQLQ